MVKRLTSMHESLGQHLSLQPCKTEASPRYHILPENLSAHFCSYNESLKLGAPHFLFNLISPSSVLSSLAAVIFFQISSLGAFHGLRCYLDSSRHPPVFALRPSFQLSWRLPLGLAFVPQGICQRWICQGRNNSHPCELREHM